MGIAGPLAEELRRRIASTGVRLTQHPKSADAVLSGTVVSSSTAAIGLSLETQVFNATATFEAILVDSEGAVLWQQRFVSRDDYFQDDLTATGILRTEKNRRVALTRLTQDLATQVHHSLLQAKP